MSERWRSLARRPGAAYAGSALITVVLVTAMFGIVPVAELVGARNAFLLWAAAVVTGTLVGGRLVAIGKGGRYSGRTQYPPYISDGED